MVRENNILIVWKYLQDLKNLKNILRDVYHSKLLKID